MTKMLKLQQLIGLAAAVTPAAALQGVENAASTAVARRGAEVAAGLVSRPNTSTDFKHAVKWTQWMAAMAGERAAENSAVGITNPQKAVLALFAVWRLQAFKEGGKKSLALTAILFAYLTKGWKAGTAVAYGIWLYNRHYMAPRNAKRSIVNQPDPLPHIPEAASDAIWAFDRKFFGLYDLLNAVKDDLFDWQTARMEKSGNKTFVQHFVGLPPIVFSKDPQNVEYALSKNFKNWPKGDTFRELFQDLLGEGIFAVDGAEWKFQRKISSHAFTQNIFKDFMYDVMMKHIKEVEHIFLEHKETCFFSVINRFTVDSIGEIGFGTNLNTLENFPEPHPFLNAFDSAQFTTLKRIQEPWWPVTKMLNVGKEKQFVEDMKVLNGKSLEIAQAIKKQFQETGKGGSDFLSLFLKKAKQEKTELSDKFLADVALNFLIAGRDTTACTLSWIMFELTQNPDVLAKAREEIKTVLNGEELRFEHLTQFKYLKQIQDETLRLHPVVPQDVHYNLEDDTFPDGTAVKAGTAFIYLSYSQGRDTDVWGADAKEFKPDRWLNEDKAARDFQFKYPVFHAGPRICLGRHMATMEMTIALAHLLPRFDIELAMPAEEVAYQVTIVLQIKDKLQMKFTPRDPKA